MEAPCTKMPECSPPIHTYCMYCTTYSKFLIAPVAQQPLMGQGFLITVASQSHSDTPHSHRTPVNMWLAQCKDVYMTTHNTQRDRHPCPPPRPRRIQTHDSSKQTATDLRLKPHGHWNRPKFINTVRIHFWLVSQYWHVTFWLNSQFCLCTVNKILTKSLPRRLQVNALKSSRNWFMTGHSTPTAIKMLACGSHFPAGAWTTETIRYRLPQLIQYNH
jgi:hypothetical protein